MNKRKKAALVAALSLSASILLSGTFAWRSISQEAKNELVRSLNPGARLHDDFDGNNKDVYVENFFTAAEGGQPIFARVRLDEYMEVGPDSGVKLDQEDRNVTVLAKSAKDPTQDADINDVTTWRTHLPGDDPEKGDPTDPFHAHWSWKMGGSTTYMPTFNKNKDSLKADINGTWANRFGDYDSYEKGEKVKKTACYDNDDNNIEDENTILVEETHTAKETPTATVLTMQKWIENGRNLGNFWVYDTDGWAYWAQPLAPGDTTGLLLDSITPLTDGPSYYGINVVGQFVTANAWGTRESGDGFYAENAGAPPTDNALLLLNLAAGLEYTVELTPQIPEGEAPPAEGDPLTIKPGETLQFQASVACAGTEISTQTVTWTLSGATQEGTTLDENGLLTVAAEEPLGTVLTVTAQSWTGAASAVEVTVAAPSPDPGTDPEPGTDPDPETDPETNPDPGTDPGPGTDPDPVSPPDLPTVPDSDPEAGTEADPEPVPDPETGTESDPETGPKTDLKTDPETDPGTVPALDPLLPPDA